MPMRYGVLSSSGLVHTRISENERCPCLPARGLYQRLQPFAARRLHEDCHRYAAPQSATTSPTTIHPTCTKQSTDSFVPGASPRAQALCARRRPQVPPRRVCAFRDVARVCRARGSLTRDCQRARTILGDSGTGAVGA